MNTNLFLASLEGFERVRPEDLIAQLHRAFMAITQLDVDQAVAGYQTLTFLHDSTESVSARKQIRVFQEAVKVRMTQIVQGLQTTDPVRVAQVRATFSKVTELSALALG